MNRVVPTMTFLRNLEEEPWRFDYFTVLRHLERNHPDKPRIGDSASRRDEYVQLGQDPFMEFPASNLARAEAEDGKPLKLFVKFLGLLGPQGALPLATTEEAYHFILSQDDAFSRFLDIFNHRAISLFYRAWQRSRFPVTYSAGPRDLFTRYLLDLIGLGTDGLRDRQEMRDEALLHYASLVAMQSRSATALEQIIEDYFEVPVEIQQFTGAWYGLDRATQCSMTGLDTPSRQIGGGAVVGDAVWDRQARVRIRLGPLSMERYCDFLPEASAYTALRSLTRFFSNQCLEFEVQLVLDRAQTPGTELDFNAAIPARLGWVSWLATAPLGTDPDDTILTL